MDADDLGRMLGREFYLMVAAVRLINCGLLDELATLKFSSRISPVALRCHGYPGYGGAISARKAPPAAELAILIAAGLASGCCRFA